MVWGREEGRGSKPRVRAGSGVPGGRAEAIPECHPSGCGVPERGSSAPRE